MEIRRCITKKMSDFNVGDRFKLVGDPTTYVLGKINPYKGDYYIKTLVGDTKCVKDKYDEINIEILVTGINDADFERRRFDIYKMLVKENFAKGKKDFAYMYELANEATEEYYIAKSKQNK